MQKAKHQRAAGQKGQAVLRLRRAQGIPTLSKTERMYWIGQAAQANWQGSLLEFMQSRKEQGQ